MNVHGTVFQGSARGTLRYQPSVLLARGDSSNRHLTLRREWMGQRALGLRLEARELRVGDVEAMPYQTSSCCENVNKYLVCCGGFWHQKVGV